MKDCYYNHPEECSAEIIIYPYQTQEVRDLAWTCFSPPLLHMGDLGDASTGVSDCTPVLTPERRLWLEQLDRDAAPLLEHLSQCPSHRLGVYFEQLWHFFLGRDRESELVAHNLPIHGEGRTLGEFDCLYYCKRRMRYVHLELAVKYYLASPEEPDEGQAARTWLGPDTRDRLDLKLTQLLKKQIRLSESTAAESLLSELGVERPLREVTLKGYLFQPLTGAQPPPGYNNANPMNDWLRPGDLPQYCAANKLDAFRLLPKMQWLSQSRLDDVCETLDREQLQAEVETHFESDNYPLLVASPDDPGTERRRFFVVPEHWPGSA